MGFHPNLPVLCFQIVGHLAVELLVNDLLVCSFGFDVGLFAHYRALPHPIRSLHRVPALPLRIFFVLAPLGRFPCFQWPLILTPQCSSVASLNFAQSFLCNFASKVSDPLYSVRPIPLHVHPVPFFIALFPEGAGEGISTSPPFVG